MAEASLTALSGQLRERYPCVAQLGLELDGCSALVHSNSKALLATLSDYFRHITVDAPRRPLDLEIVALQAPEPSFATDFIDWPREAGKQGRKEEFADLADGRIVRKVRTGMQFLLGDPIVAIGDCEKNANQVINLVNSQYITYLAARGYVLCHSAAVAHQGQGLALSGVSGAGKSTLALHLISGGMNFVSNDRLLVRRAGDQVEMRGVPKLPRINPGTILGNPDLWPILSEQRLAEVRAMPREELWELEEKYDADVERLFGPGRIQGAAPLAAFVVLTWSHRNGGATRLEETTFGQRPELLDTVMKHPGPFVPEARPAALALKHDPAPYLKQMADLPVLAVSGGVDFEHAAARCRAILGQPG